MSALRDVPLTLYGTGFFGFPVNGVKRQENYDRDVVSLYQRLVDGTPLDDWKYERQVLSTLYRLMYPITDWVEMNSHNPNLNFTSLEFIRDTLRFIHTGRRDTNVQIAGQLIDNWSDRQSLSSHQRLESSGKLMSYITLSDEEMVCTWLHWDNGIQDIICTLNAVFGQPMAPGFKGF
ncbi:hypothetical protein IU811_003891 [Salmonella enterica]|nr:hypothetical protein [Salmonella enterica]